MFQRIFIKKISNYYNKWKRDNVNLIKFINDNDVQLFHCTENGGIPSKCPCKSVLTVHDAIPLELEIYSKYRRIRFRNFVESSIKLSSKVITVSDYSAKIIKKQFNIRSNNIVVIPLPYDTDFHQLELNENTINEFKKMGIRKPYFLISGGDKIHKNVQRVVDIFISNDYWKKYQLAILGTYQKLVVPDNNVDICLLGNVSKKTLIKLYNFAELFLFPSYYEGFGLPILEAMGCATPVLTSNITSMPEVGGDACIMVDPYDSLDIKLKIDYVLSNKAFQQEMIERGLERVKKYTLSNFIKNTIGVYNSVIN